MTIETNQSIIINNIEYRISEHPQAKGMPYGQEGRKAVVYQLVGPNGNKQALKVFKRRFRIPRMSAIAEKLEPYAGLPGLQVCKRTVLTATSHSDLLVELPELAYAIFMPWIDGQTWQESMLERKPLTAQKSLDLARSLTQVLVKMEEQGLAHCDLSGPNIILSSGGQVILVDLEEMYGPTFIKSDALPSGSPGYGHRTAGNGLWGSSADRFSGAVILAEMLGWCDEVIRKEAWGESYFSAEELQQSNSRFDLLESSLRQHWGKRLADLFVSVWNSDTLDDCPTLAEWMVALPKYIPVPIESTPEKRDPDLEKNIDSFSEFIALGKKFEAQGNMVGARMTYQHALSLVKPDSPQGQVIQTTLQNLSEEKQAANPLKSVMVEMTDITAEQKKDWKDVEDRSGLRSNSQSAISEQEKFDQSSYHLFLAPPEVSEGESNGIDKQSTVEDKNASHNCTIEQYQNKQEPNNATRHATAEIRYADAKKAIDCKDWKSAKQYLEVVLFYEQDFHHESETAQDLLSQVESELVKEKTPFQLNDPENAVQSDRQDPNTTMASVPDNATLGEREKDFPLTAIHLFNNARAEMNLGNWAEAKELAEKLIQFWPAYQTNGQTANDLLQEINYYIRSKKNSAPDDAYSKKIAWGFILIILGLVLFFALATAH